MKYESTLEDPFSMLFLDDFIKLKWWSTLEAAFILTEWPKNTLWQTHISPRDHLPLDVQEDRAYFYLPERPFNPKKYSEAFQNVFEEIFNDIEDRNLEAKYAPIDSRVSYVVNPFEVIKWSIKKGYPLNESLDKILHIKKKRQKQPEPWRKKVKIMVIGQWIRKHDPTASIEDIINDDLMKNLLKELDKSAKNENQRKQLRNDLRIVLKGAGPGRRRKNGCRENIEAHESFKVIPQVLEKRKACFHCDFDLLEIVVTMILDLIVNEVGTCKDIIKLSELHFSELVLKEALLKLYLEGVPPFIEYWIKVAIKRKYQFFQEIFRWQALSSLFSNGREIKWNSLKVNNV